MHGLEQPPDDPSVADDCKLYRRIPPSQVVQDDNLGRKRPSSANFRNSSDGSPMSIGLGDTLAEGDRQPSDLLRNYPDHRLASFTAGFVRSLEQRLIRSPIEDEPAHGGVIGNKTDRVRKKMSEEACWEI